MAEHPPKQPKAGQQHTRSAAARPQCLVSLWQDERGIWRGRLKSLSDGAEQTLGDLSELPDLLELLRLDLLQRELLRKDPHAQA